MAVHRDTDAQPPSYCRYVPSSLTERQSAPHARPLERSSETSVRWIKPSPEFARAMWDWMEVTPRDHTVPSGDPDAEEPYYFRKHFRMPCSFLALVEVQAQLSQLGLDGLALDVEAGTGPKSSRGAWVTKSQS